MTFQCEDLDRALASEDPALMDAADRHARSCSRCEAELRLWSDMAAGARSMHRRWNSPTLWPRIRAELVSAGVARGRRFVSFIPLAAAAVLVLATASAWWMWRQPNVPTRQTDTRLLGDQAVREVERAEADYVHAIDRLSSIAAARVDAPSSPLILALREKLLLIDAAIVQCRAEIDHNPFNAHLRRELLAMYREKRQTLDEIINAPRNGS
jgi:hypothetical protein